MSLGLESLGLESLGLLAADESGGGGATTTISATLSNITGSVASLANPRTAIAATLACLFYALPRITRAWHAVVLGMLLAGITGNLVDRIFQPPAALHGHVIDMFQLRGFAIFNVADVFITCSAAALVAFSFLGGKTAAEPVEA